MLIWLILHFYAWGEFYAKKRGDSVSPFDFISLLSRRDQNFWLEMFLRRIWKCWKGLKSIKTLILHLNITFNKQTDTLSTSLDCHIFFKWLRTIFWSILASGGCIFAKHTPAAVYWMNSGRAIRLIFQKKNFHGQRRALQLENSTIALLRTYPLCPSNYFPPFPSLAPWFLIIYIDPCISFVTIHLN